MGTMEVNKKRQETISITVMNTKNEDIIAAMFDLAKIEGERPCQYSNSEIEDRICLSLKDEKEGRIVTIEDLEKEYL